MGRVDPSDLLGPGYKSRRPGQAVLEGRIKEICQTRVRYGYRRVQVLVRREGWRINHKKTYRIYREMGLQLRNKTAKRRVKAKLREDRTVATRPNETWSMDFVHDQLATGRKLRVLTVVDILHARLPPIHVGRGTASGWRRGETPRSPAEGRGTRRRSPT